MNPTIDDMFKYERRILRSKYIDVNNSNSNPNPNNTLAIPVSTSEMRKDD